MQSFDLRQPEDPRMKAPFTLIVHRVSLCSSKLSPKVSKAYLRSQRSASGAPPLTFSVLHLGPNSIEG